MADIVHSIEVPASPEELYPYVASGEGFKAWWAEDVSDMADGAVELGFFSRSTIYRLKPTDLVSSRKATWRCETGEEWKGTQLIFELEKRGAATLLRFTHAGWQRASEYFVSCNTTWGGLMFRLRAAAAGRSPGPLFKKNALAY